LLGALLAPNAAAQAPRRLELSAGALAALAARPFYGAGLGLARRADQARVSLGTAAGSWDGHAGLRFEATLQLLAPTGGPSSVVPYGGLGLVGQVAQGSTARAYVMVLVGMETAPARVAGFYAEAGVGGGMRHAVGKPPPMSKP
jgi:hypothetical protein